MPGVVTHVEAIEQQTSFSFSPEYFTRLPSFFRVHWRSPLRVGRLLAPYNIGCASGGVRMGCGRVSEQRMTGWGPKENEHAPLNYLHPACTVSALLRSTGYLEVPRRVTARTRICLSLFQAWSRKNHWQTHGVLAVVVVRGILMAENGSRHYFRVFLSRYLPKRKTLIRRNIKYMAKKC
jgi:hypothetical protein